jgi:serine/threonine protein kinase
MAMLPVMIQEKSESNKDPLTSSNIFQKPLPLIPNACALEKMFDEGCNAIIFEDFDGISLRKYYPSIINNTSLENLMDKSDGSMVSLERKVDVGNTNEEPELPKFEFEEILQIFIQLSEAVDLLHRSKVVHFNINPSNILIQKNKQKILVQLINFESAVASADIISCIGRNLRGYTYSSPGTN